jgi:hypothetical protein
VTNLLRWENGTWPLFRVLVATEFGADGSGPWVEYDNMAVDGTGLLFEECTRQALPGIGDATLSMEFGTIDGETVTPYDLRDLHIRIQAARVPVNETDDPEWITIWVGRCEWQTDIASAGASEARGTRRYYCIDLLRTYLAGYTMDRHANYAVTGALSYGHPGYNTERVERAPYVSGGTMTVGGNKDSTGSSYAGPDTTNIANFATVDAGASVSVRAWTDAEIAENVMLVRRNAGDPIFTLDVATDGANTTLDGESVIAVDETEKSWDVLLRVLDRKRGKGIAFLDWEDDRADPTGPLDVRLRVWPQLFAATVYTYPLGTDNIVLGSGGTEAYWTRVDLQNDQRVVDGVFDLRETSDSAVDELTTEGERIEVVVTASGADYSLAERWSSELETAWAAAGEQDEAKYRPVLQYFGLLRSAGGNYKNGDASASGRADYWTDEDGFITIAHTCVTAPSSIDVMDDLPIYEGYDYSVDPPVPAASAAQDGTPRRRKPVVLVRTTTNRFLADSDYIQGGAQMSVDRDGIWVEWAGDDDGFRSIRTEWPGVSARAITEDSLTLTIGLRMPQRVRFTSAVTIGDIRRRKTIRIADRHLWIAHPGAIWDLDATSYNADGSNAKRIGGTIGSIPGKILRDDRAALARIHAMAWEWYRSDADRLGATWAIRDCGMLPSWNDLSGTARTYPKLGQVVWELTANGDTHTIDTPISRVHYSNVDGATTWKTDWAEFDYGSA